MTTAATAEAEAQWRLAITEQPDYLPTWLGLAELYLSTPKRLGEVEPIIERLGTVQPGSIWSPILRARL